MAENDMHQIKEKVESLKDDAQKIIDELGVKVTYLSEETAKKVVEWKSNLDTTTRREVRKYWIGVSIVTFLLGYGLALLLI